MAISGRSRLVVAVAGTDSWMRPDLIKLLTRVGMDVRAMGAGSASLFGVDVLVLVPAIAPLSGSAGRDVGVSAANITFSAMTVSNVPRAVVVSRLGSDAESPNEYLAALGDLERRASVATSKLTLIRLAHPFGPPDRPGPLVNAAASFSTGGEPSPDNQAMVQPVYLEDAVALVLAGLDGRIGSGAVELGGPETMPFREFAKLAASVSEPLKRRSRWGLPSGRRRYRQAMGGLLAANSVAARKFAPPFEPELRGPTEVWRDRRSREELPS